MGGAMTKRGAPDPTSMLCVCDGATCAGFVLARGRTDFEVFAADGETSLGTFATQVEAVAAISAAFDGSAR